MKLTATYKIEMVLRDATRKEAAEVEEALYSLIDEHKTALTLELFSETRERTSKP